LLSSQLLELFIQLVGLNKGAIMKKSLIGLMLGIVLCFGSVQEASALTGMELKTVCDSANNPKHTKLPGLLFNLMEITAMNICYKEIQISDFKSGTLLYLIAKENIQLACRIAQQFGGSKEYIQ